MVLRALSPARMRRLVSLRRLSCIFPTLPPLILIHCTPLVGSTDEMSSRILGQLLVEQNGHPNSKCVLWKGHPACKVNFFGTQPWTLQPGCTVLYRAAAEQSTQGLLYPLSFRERGASMKFPTRLWVSRSCAAKSTTQGTARNIRIFEIRLPLPSYFLPSTYSD